MERWLTGEKAEMEQEDVDRELFELARESMSVSTLRKLPGHVAKEPDVARWKQFREYQKHEGVIPVRLSRCPLSRLRHYADVWSVSASWRECSSIGAASTMQTVTMRISPSIAGMARLFRSQTL